MLKLMGKSFKRYKNSDRLTKKSDTINFAVIFVNKQLFTALFQKCREQFESFE